MYIQCYFCSSLSMIELFSWVHWQWAMKESMKSVSTWIWNNPHKINIHGYWAIKSKVNNVLMEKLLQQLYCVLFLYCGSWSVNVISFLISFRIWGFIWRWRFILSISQSLNKWNGEKKKSDKMDNLTEYTNFKQISPILRLSKN